MIGTAKEVILLGSNTSVSAERMIVTLLLSGI